VFIGLILIQGDVSAFFKNASNILFLRDSQENIGLYYYISIEIFLNHTDFFLVAYQFFAAFLIVNTYYLFNKACTVLRMSSPFYGD